MKKAVIPIKGINKVFFPKLVVGGSGGHCIAFTPFLTQESSYL